MAECHVCFRKYDTAERKPRSLPCGHALCQQCVTAADAVRARGAADNNPYHLMGCPFCRHPIPDWLALPLNHAVMDVLEQQSPSTGDDPREPPSPRLNSSKVVHRAPSATQLPDSSSSSSCKALQGKDAVMLIAHYVKQLYSRELLQQLQAVTALAEQTKLRGVEEPSFALAADIGTRTSISAISELERRQEVCRQIVDAGGFAALLALLQQTLDQDSTSADAGPQDGPSAVEVQQLGTEVLWSLMMCLPEGFQSAVNAGVVPVLQQLLGSPLVSTQLGALNTLLALATSSNPAVQAAVLRQELFAPAAALLGFENTDVQISSIELLQLLLREHQQADTHPAAASATCTAAGEPTALQTAVAALARLLGSRNAEVEQAAYTALWAFIGTAGPSVVAQQAATLLGHPRSASQLAGCDLLIGLLKHFSGDFSVEELTSAGVVEASLRLLGSAEPAVQAAAAQAAAALAFNREGVRVLVSIPETVQLLVDLLRWEDTQESAATALRWVAENSIPPWQPEAVQGHCGAEILAAGAIPAALDLLRSTLALGSKQGPSKTARSLLLML